MASENFQCNFYRKVLSSERNLKIHKNIHLRTHQCVFCNIFLRRSENLDFHYLRHIHEKPHFCDTCQKIFACRSDLTNHRKVHAVKKPFSCKHCPKSFSRDLT